MGLLEGRCMETAWSRKKAACSRFLRHSSTSRNDHKAISVLGSAAKPSGESCGCARAAVRPGRAQLRPGGAALRQKACLHALRAAAPWAQSNWRRRRCRPPPARRCATFLQPILSAVFHLLKCSGASDQAAAQECQLQLRVAVAAEAPQSRAGTLAEICSQPSLTVRTQGGSSHGGPARLQEL